MALIVKTCLPHPDFVGFERRNPPDISRLLRLVGWFKINPEDAENPKKWADQLADEVCRLED